MKVLVNLIGGQPAPVYIATRTINPDKVVLVFSKDSEAQVRRIKNTLTSYNYDELEVSPYNFDDCYEKLSDKLKETSSNEVIMNLTSGTKIMSIAGFKVFDEANKEIIYIDSQNHFLIRITKEKEITQSQINVQFGIKDYFSLYGYLTETGNERFPDNETFAQLNRICSTYFALLKNIIAKINIGLKEKKSIIEVKDDSSQCYFRYDYKKSKGILKITQGRNTIETGLISPEMIAYITGYWLEDFIYNKIRNLRIFDELQRNLKIFSIRDNLQPEYLNEFDIVGIRNQTLYIFECKSGNIDKGIIEKLRLIKLITGTYSKIYLISLFAPTNTSVIERIKDFNIPVIKFNNVDKFFEEFKSRIDVNPNL